MSVDPQHFTVAVIGDRGAVEVSGLRLKRRNATRDHASGKAAVRRR
jgi:hypothetical protein